MKRALLSLVICLVALCGCIETDKVGDVVFWTDESTIYDITVKLEGKKKTITDYYTSKPSSCDASGCATFYDIEEGKHKYSAENRLYVWEGEVEITNGGCLKVLLYSDKAKQQANPDGQSAEKLTLCLDEE